MKVSNRNDIQRIYQDQIKKAHSEKSGDGFKKVMQQASEGGEVRKPSFHPPSGITSAQTILSGKPIPQADPVETMKFAAEVVANDPDVRQERIDRIKALIDGGKYNVSPDKVAARLLASGVLTRSWED